jgi:pilus assembly protein CpaB
MDRRFLTVLGVSLVFALVVSSVFYQMTARSNGTKRADVSDQKDIVVATRPLSVGVMIKPADVKVLRIATDGFPKGAFSKVEEVLDRPVVSGILLDEPVLEGRLAAKGSGLGLAPTIPVGMRAVAVRVNDVAGVAGFVLPGMRVDVLVTGRPPGNEGTITNTCLQNIPVLSAGQIMQADARGQAIQAPTVTLLVSPEQAETLTLANNEGHIQLVLRNSSDQTIEKTTGRNVTELYGAAVRNQGPAIIPVKVESEPRPGPRPRKVAVAAPAPPPLPIPPPPVALAPAPPPGDQVVVIRGTIRTVETLPPVSKTTANN